MPDDPDRAGGSGLIASWWIGWILSGLAVLIATSAAADASTLQGVRDRDLISIVFLSVRIVLAVLAALIVIGITRLQGQLVISPPAPPRPPDGALPPPPPG